MICQSLYSNMKMYTQYQTICSSNYSKVQNGINTEPRHICVHVPSKDIDFKTLYVMVFIMFNDCGESLLFAFLILVEL